MTSGSPHFTPGPWTLEGGTSGTYKDGERHPLVTGPNRENPICVFEGDWNTEWADARLVAAAPDLYAAVENAVRCIESSLAGHTVLVSKYHMPLRAALAKASGETPTPIGSIAPQGDANSKDKDRATILRFLRAGSFIDRQAADLIFRLSEQVEKQGKVVEELRRGCPCTYGSPCNPRCTCVTPASSVGCARCCLYGSRDQRAARAKRLIAALNGLVVVGDSSGLPAAERQEPNGRDDPDSARGTVRQ